MSKKEAVALAAIFALGSFVRLYGLADYPTWAHDEGTYIDQSRNLIQWRFEIFGARILTQGPLVFFLTSLVFRFAGYEVFVARLSHSIWGIATILVVYALGRKLYDSRVGLLAALIFALQPFLVTYNRLFLPDSAAGFFFATSLLALAAHLDSQSARSAVLTGALAGLATLTKLTGAAAIMATFILATFRSGSKRNLALLLGTAIVVAAPYPILGYLSNAMGWHGVYARDGLPEWFGAGLMGNWLLEGALAAPFVIALGYLVAGRHPNDQFLVVATLAQFFFLATGYFRGWHLAQFLFLGCLALGRLIVEVWDELPRAPAKSVTLALLLLLLPGAKFVSLIAPTFGVELGIRVKLGLLWGGLGLLAVIYLLARRGLSRTSRLLVSATLVGVLVIMPAWHIQGYAFEDQASAGGAKASDFRAAVEFLRPQLGPADLFVGHPAVASQLDSRRRGPGWNGEAARAKYLEIDSFWRRSNNKDVPDLVKDWPVVFRSGAVTIYENPAFVEKASGP